MGDLTRVINRESDQLSGKHYVYNEKILVAGGQAFVDLGLNPHEKISATYVFYIPQGRYDLLAVEVVVPTTATGSASAGSAIKIDYKWDGSTYTPASFARVNSDGAETEILHPTRLSWDSFGASLGVQVQVRKLSSLWQTDKPRITTENPEGTR